MHRRRSTRGGLLALPLTRPRIEALTASASSRWCPPRVSALKPPGAAARSPRGPQQRGEPGRRDTVSRLAWNPRIEWKWTRTGTTRPTERSATLESGRRDLNPRPLQPHCSALPDCATSRITEERNSTPPPRLAEGSDVTVPHQLRTVSSDAIGGVSKGTANSARHLQGRRAWPLWAYRRRRVRDEPERWAALGR